MSDQAAFLARLWAPQPPQDSPGLHALPSVPLAEGLRVYRENAKALAVRALGAAYPRVQAWLGVEDFAGLAWAHARAHPPALGDAAAWGEALADHLAGLPGMAQLGPDLARLDWALHRVATAADAPPADPAMWDLLQQASPERLRLRLSPGLCCLFLPSLLDPDAWTLAQQGGPASDPVPGVHVLVWRQGWQPCWTTTGAGAAHWTAALLAGTTLAEALEATLAVHPDFDLGSWLALAWQRQWVLGADVV